MSLISRQQQYRETLTGRKGGNPAGTVRKDAYPEADSTSAALTSSAPRPRGRPKGGKTQVTIRLDDDVLAAFKATGAGWQSKMNDVLKRNKP